jgi:type IV secretion system protein TrbB
MPAGTNEPRSPRAEIERRLVAAMRQQLGPIICDRLDDHQVVEILLNSDGRVWEDRLGVGMTQITTMSPVAALSFISTVASTTHGSVTREAPILEAELPIRGARFEAIIPPIVPAPVFTIRLKAVKVFTLADYVSAGIMTDRQREAIECGVAGRKNILICGGTGSGKTTLGNAILAAVAGATPHDRLVILEDTVELQCAAQNVVALRTSDTVDMQRLLRATMRMRPDRIIVGEVRGGEALSMLKAWNTGHPGGLCTIHANDAHAALLRLEQLVAEATQSEMRAVIAEAVDLIVPIAKTQQGSRVVNDILRVEGFRAGEYVLSTLET